MPEESHWLDRLTRAMDCTYLSDLRFLNEEWKERLFFVVELVSAREAPVSQWNDALCYLAGYGRIAASSAEVRSLLLKYLQSGEAWWANTWAVSPASSPSFSF